MQKSIEIYYSRVARLYESRSKSWPWALLRNVERRAVENALVGKRSNRTLDLGCGAGYYTQMLYDRFGDRVVAIDSNREMLRRVPDLIARKQMVDAHDSFGHADFDLVLCCGMLEFCESEDKVFENIYTALRAPGCAILLVPENSFAGQIYYWAQRMRRISIKLFGAQEIKYLSMRAGFNFTSTVRVRPWSLLVELRKNDIG